MVNARSPKAVSSLLQHPGHLKYANHISASSHARPSQQTWQPQPCRCFSLDLLPNSCSTGMSITLPPTNMASEEVLLCRQCERIFIKPRPLWAMLCDTFDDLSPTTCSICAYICTFIRRHVHDPEDRTLVYCFERLVDITTQWKPYSRLLIELAWPNHNQPQQRLALLVVPLDGKTIARMIPRC